MNTNAGWGGGERWFADAASALIRRGHRVLQVAAPGSEIEKRGRAAGADVVAPEDLEPVLREQAPQVLLCNSRKDVERARQAARGLEIKIAFRRGIDRPLRDNLFRRKTWKCLSRILVNSDATGDKVRRSLPWFPNERITRIYNPQNFEPLEAVPAADARIRIGVVSRLVPQKAIHVLLQALASLPARIEWSCTVAGDGQERKSLQALAAELGVDDRCRFLGHRDDPREVYRALDIVAIPSRYEGFCYTAAEAALAGLPVVASAISSLLEVVLDGRTGVLVPPEDPRALSAALESLATDPERRAAMGREARESALRRFDPEVLYREVEEFLEVAASQEPVGG